MSKLSEHITWCGIESGINNYCKVKTTNFLLLNTVF